MFTDVQLPFRQGRGWGRGEARIPPAAPTLLTLLYMLLYICTVHELCSQTVGEYRLSTPSPPPSTRQVHYVLLHPFPLVGTFCTPSPNIDVLPLKLVK
jgi:hypothetical protein